jgi:hypothetical protein
MKKWLRRIRGAVGMGLTWAIAWFGAGMIMVLGLLLFTGARADVPFPLVFGAFGLVAGVTFSGVLGLVEARRRFDQMSHPRFAGWGAIGGFLLSAIFVVAVAVQRRSFDRSSTAPQRWPRPYAESPCSKPGIAFSLRVACRSLAAPGSTIPPTESPWGRSRQSPGWSCKIRGRPTSSNPWDAFWSLA